MYTLYSSTMFIEYKGSHRIHVRRTERIRKSRLSVWLVSKWFCENNSGSRACSVQLKSFHSFIHSFIHSGHFYSAPSSSLLLSGAPDYIKDTVSEFHAEAHRQLQVKDLPKVPT